jgi:DNA recombination-dependent growth factor C
MRISELRSKRKARGYKKERRKMKSEVKDTYLPNLF